MKSSTNFRVVAMLLALALVTGGAGQTYPRLQLFLNLCALAVAFYFLFTHKIRGRDPLIRVAMSLFGAILVLPLIQLIPLPYSIWSSLPGREIPIEVDAIIGSTPWRPVSLDIEATISAFVSLAPPTAVFVGSLFLAKGERFKLLWIIVALAIASAVLGIIQLVSGGGITPYLSAHVGYPVGLFVNRNHNAFFLLAAMPLVAALCARMTAAGRPSAPLAAFSLSTILVLGMASVGTTSRMGLILLPVSLATSVGVILYQRATTKILTASIVAGLAVTTVLASGHRFDRVLDRFVGLEDLRFSFWTDVWWAIENYGLAGTGIGTFIPVYRTSQSLDSLGPMTVNHAHNDFLELLLEGGVVGAILMLVFTAFLAATIYRSIKTARNSQEIAIYLAIIVSILLIIIGSTVDFPLRMPALSCSFVVLLSILLPNPPNFQNSPQALHSKGRVGPLSFMKTSAILATAGMVFLSVGTAASSYYLSKGQPENALSWAPWSTQAHERLATQALVEHEFEAAAAHGQSATTLSPISAAGVRSIGVSHIARGAVNSGNNLMIAASSLGWHDPLTQLWAIEAAKISGESEKAVQRAEALFKREVLVTEAIAKLFSPPRNTGVVAQLARSLARRPAWRGRFFQSSADLGTIYAAEWFELVTLLESTRAPVSMDEGRPLVDALHSSGQTANARRLWVLISDDSRLVRNGDFEQVDVEDGVARPRSWNIPRRNRWLVTVEPTGFRGNRALIVRGSDDPVILSQALMLQPGEYVLEFRAKAERRATLQWEIWCGRNVTGPATLFTTPPRSQWIRFTALLNIPSECAAQTIALTRQGQSSPSVQLDDVTLERRRH